MSQPQSACALCNYQPEQDGTNALRVLGAEPVTITVCADLAACVSRFDQGAPEPDERVDNGNRSVPA